MKTTNQAILAHLTTAPEVHLSERLRGEAETIDSNDPAAIRSYFHKVYAESECERSRFVAELINPKFTDDPEYNTPKAVDKK
jgi:hypothetical protein